MRSRNGLLVGAQSGAHMDPETWLPNGLQLTFLFVLYVDEDTMYIF